MKREVPCIRPRWSEVFIYAAIGLGPLALACSSFAQAGYGRCAIGPSQVASAMREGQLPFDGVEIRFAAPVTASNAAARIEVESVSLLGPHQVRLRLACSDHSECLPFFATVTFPDGVDVSTLHLVRGVGAKGGPDDQPVSQTPVIRAADAHQPVKIAAANGGESLRAGATATLRLEADRIHVRIEVISLQSGVPGSRVKVSSLDHKQIYTAEIVTPTLLKGELLK